MDLMEDFVNAIIKFPSCLFNGVMTAFLSMIMGEGQELIPQPRGITGTELQCAVVIRTAADVYRGCGTKRRMQRRGGGRRKEKTFPF